MEIILIRHGYTKENLQKKYLGVTDAALCQEGRELLLADKKRGRYPAEASCVYVSPMKRCMETAELLYPEAERYILDGFKECDFGIFEGKDYHELSEVPEYQKWIDSKGTLPFPGGEAREDFKSRCVNAMKQVFDRERIHNRDISKKIILIVHGGTIMSVLEYFCQKKLDFYTYQLGNGSGIVCEWINDGHQDQLVPGRIL